MEENTGFNQGILELKTMVGDLQGQVNQLQYQIAKITNPVLDKLMSTKEVADYLQVTTNWVILHKHEIGSSKRTGKLTFKRSDVQAFPNTDYYKKK